MNDRGKDPVGLHIPPHGALRESEQTFVELVEQMPFGVYIVDADFRIAYMNPISQEVAFRNIRPIIGRPFDEAVRILWPEPVATESIAVFRRTLGRGTPHRSQDCQHPRPSTQELHR